jgi:hypothetical protein
VTKKTLFGIFCGILQIRVFAAVSCLEKIVCVSDYKKGLVLLRSTEHGIRDSVISIAYFFVLLRFNGLNEWLYFLNTSEVKLNEWIPEKANPFLPG